ncbi:multidrug efflux system membrane fusion protein [Roseiarcus fermentans]|uniref:Multidrug efflux system membrane fusion protein n=1 Tax=Roseiarcus fermentans TaxID=1473586 RepID=A0A366ERL2_9HYPH|nr:MdtA/MuxA family multidrug efflux RND transporter periplasmic adaptor subunit [Roseiarcus fermentans]RBP05028.1 multidrug efflux system membrane fusion protein [Roseiarcus fermentans]
MNEAFKPEVAERVAPAPPGPEIPAPAPEPKAPPRRRRLLVRIALVVVLAAVAVFAWQRFDRHETAPKEGVAESGRAGPPPQTVRVAPVATGDMPITLDALGTVTPFETVTIRTQIAGTLMNLGFTEGQTVKKGDFLAQIDPRPYQAALAQAQGQLAKDQALLAQAENNLDRYEALIKQDSISKQQVTDQEALVQQDKAAIQSDQAAVQTAQINLNYAHIVSPIDGRVGLRLVDPGNYLQPSDSTGIVVVTQLDPISVVFATAEDNLPRIAARLASGATLPVTAFNRANVDKLAEGTLTAYDSQVDITTGTIKMRATFANPNGVLFPQQFVNVRLLVDTLKGVVLAPNAAVQIGPSGDYVYLLNADGTVTKRDIVAGPSNATSTTITSGLAAGDRIVIDGVDRLRDGAKVTVVGAPGEAAPGGGAEACAAKLSPEAKAIYAAASAGFAAADDPRAFVKGKVQDLVKAGTVQKDSARPSAMAARACLDQLSAAGAPPPAGGRPAGGAQPAAQGAAK